MAISELATSLTCKQLHLTVKDVAFGFLVSGCVDVANDS